ncbi:methylmalonyl-CoA mutase subunit beta [Flagellimonas halotolerans]|uniref:Methylmalonyl-CoA mutase subunit beta n=1 Tax=Flagellimonas halotolerans TaxID=3112164 RepID=A0ABU6IQM9_9FLAO|nr:MULTISPECIES: methylmalonyl-CoA mutase subunit beta [unclassified Allomuricauda]MEC3965559.1 methylmalonyl-CoA mutase subunit beta [Muricauda sp. SYSU M86414]MEC4265425.1 methylmalonyl-CoA mutase subunit beta [Muricauda sp. SYSU M84420]
MSNTGLFNEFPEVSAKQWKQKIQMDLKGDDYNETLVWESLEGINVKPFYHQEDIADIPSFSLPKDHDWSVGQSMYVGDAKKANTKAQEILEKGVESIVFTIPNEKIDFETLFSGINLETVLLYFNFEFLALEPVEKLVSLLKGKKAKAHLNIDIIGHLAKDGNWYHKLEKDHKLLTELVSLGTSDISITGVDLSLYQNAGANMVQQLAYGLAHANEYLNQFVPSSGVGKSLPITFKVAVGSNYFFEMAKVKALRWLWNSLASEYDIQGKCNILAIPSKRNKTLYDYNVNMLRTTSESMSAVLGGADTVCNLAYDAIYHKDNEFGERIARNQLLLLKEESYLARASQISEGTYYIESLTNQLAEKALVLFKQIEKAGGFLDSLKKGMVQRKIKESADKEQQLFDKGKIISLGTNKYQNPQDRMKDELELYPFVKTMARKTIIEPIIEKRLAEASEQKRLNDE